MTQFRRCIHYEIRWRGRYRSKVCTISKISEGGRRDASIQTSHASSSPDIDSYFASRRLMLYNVLLTDLDKLYRASDKSGECELISIKVPVYSWLYSRRDDATAGSCYPDLCYSWNIILGLDLKLHEETITREYEAIQRSSGGLLSG